MDSNFYSVLYYNAVIWLTPNLKSELKQNLLSASASALRSCLMRDGFDISFEKLHNMHKNVPQTNYVLPNGFKTAQITE